MGGFSFPSVSHFFFFCFEVIMAEFQKQAKLLEAIKLTNAAQEKLKDVQKKIDMYSTNSSPNGRSYEPWII